MFKKIKNTRIYLGDCLDVMKTFPDNSISNIITDPPYGLNFMGKGWDKGVPGRIFWEEMLRICKPGAHLLAFGGTRTHHRLMCAVEDAGWEIRDCLMWIYGSGFPKSLNISKALDRAAGAEREVVGITKGKSGENLNKLVRNSGNDSINAKGCGAYGVGAKQVTIDIPITAPSTEEAILFSGYGTALKPAWEPIILARKPIKGTVAQNAIEHGTGGLNIDGCRVGYQSPADKASATPQGVCTSRSGRLAGKLQGGGLRATQPRPEQIGRWPANVILDEEAGKLLDEQSGLLKSGKLSPTNKVKKSTGWSGGSYADRVKNTFKENSDGASRFFYCPKVSKKERGEGNNHPTVKPIALMRYLCKLLRGPKPGIVLDPFVGSGSTGIACVLEGTPFIGIEKEKEYVKIAFSRLENAWKEKGAKARWARH